MFAFFISHSRADNWQQDSGFVPALGASGAAPRAIVFLRQADERYLVQGVFDRVGGTTLPSGSNLARLNSDGSLDSSFSALAAREALGSLSLGQLQPDGHVLIYTSSTLRRLNGDGSLDPNYPSLSGSFFDQNGTVYSIISGVTVRRLADSSIDPAFTAAAPFSSAIATSDARLISYSNGKLIRLQANGAIDSSYNPVLDSGIASTWTVLPDGSVFAANRVDVPAISGSGWDSYLRCYRFDPQGNRVFIAQIAWNPVSLAALLRDLVQNAGGGHTTLGIGGSLHLGTSIDVSPTGDATIAEGYDADKLTRWKVSDADLPALSLAPKITDQSQDIISSRGSTVAFSVTFTGQAPFTTQWLKNDVAVGESETTNSYFSTLRVTNVQSADAGTYRISITNALGSATSGPIQLTVPDLPVVTETPSSGAITLNTRATLRTVATGPRITNTGLFTFRWSVNGISLPSSSALSTGTLTIDNFGPTNAGIYIMSVQGAGGVLTLPPAIIGVAMTGKVAGSAHETSPDVHHPNGRIYDQILLEGAAATITADPDQTTRISFADMNDDLVQVEFSGAGTLSLVLDSPSGPAPAAKYVQPGVNYMKGHAAIIITGADETSNLAIFSVGRANAVNQGLFSNDVVYDGVADIAVVAIATTNGQFGSIRAGNVSFWATRGYTGIYAPDVAFAGPVYLGDIDARSTALPKMILGSAADVKISGGDCAQTNGRTVAVSGVTRLQFVDGSTSHGILLPAQHNQAHFEQDGIDVTDQIVESSTP
jgi:hypothetical protein